MIFTSENKEEVKMKKIIALITIVACIGTMAIGCGSDSNSETTGKTPDGSISVVPANSTQVTTKSGKVVTVTAVPSQKTKKEKQTKKAGPKKTKAKGGNLVGSWTWEGGIFVYIFNKDNTGVYTTGSDAMHFTYKINGNKVVLTYKEGGKVTLPYTVSGKKLIIKDENGDDVIYYKNKKHSKPKN